MAFAVLFSMSSRSLDGLARVEKMHERVAFARARLDELRLVNYLRPGETTAGVLDDGTTWRLDILPFVEPVPDGVRRNLNSVVRIRLTLQWQGRTEPQEWSVETYRFVPPIPDVPGTSLEDQLREIASR
jgi:hypothetical protein